MLLVVLGAWPALCLRKCRGHRPCRPSQLLHLGVKPIMQPSHAGRINGHLVQLGSGPRSNTGCRQRASAGCLAL
jgi:hypothetical protein